MYKVPKGIINDLFSFNLRPKTFLQNAKISNILLICDKLKNITTYVIYITFIEIFFLELTKY
jgi:hypothetical protein